jgi:hypothetical protein
MAAEEISNWQDLITYLEINHEEVRSSSQTSTRFAYDLDGERVPIGVYLGQSANGQPWISINTRICSVDVFRNRSALVANLDLPIGAFCLIPDHAVLRQTLPLSGLRVSNFEHTVRALATQRARLQHVATIEDADIDMPYAYVFR